MTERREDPQPEPPEVTPAGGESSSHADGEVAPQSQTGETAAPQSEIGETAVPQPATGETAAPQPATGEPTPEELEHARPARVRHAPRFGRFIGTAVAVGLLIGLVLAIVIPPPQGVGLVLAWAYLGLPLAFLLGLAAGVAAVLIDRRS